MKFLFILPALLFAVGVKSQPTVKVEVSADTVSVGEMVNITYTIENGDGSFVLPDMKGLPVISGPNSSSSFTYQNGKMTSSQSYSFRLRPLEEGKLLIPQTTYKAKTELLTIQPVEIVVVADWSKPSSPLRINETPSGKTTREKRKF
jgi:hypothetical protein